MNINLNKSENETELQYIWRLCSAKDSNVIDMTWDSLAELLNRNLRDDESEYYTSSAYRKKYQQAKLFRDEVFSKEESNEYLKSLDVQKRELQKAKVKLQTEKLEYARWIREEARDELILEKICDAINSLEPLFIPAYIPPIHNSRSDILLFSDEHYGAEFSIKGLFGEILNEYSPEIFESRMWSLLNQTLEIIKRENINNLYVFSLGDFSDGILRVGQLMKLRYGVIDGTIKYSEFICNWLTELSKYVRIEYHTTAGNHTELRMLGQMKGTFSDDNTVKILSEYMKVRLKDNPNITIVENPTGYVFANIEGYNILGIHGEVKNMEHAIKDFSKVYSIQIDYLIAGHLHHSRTQEVGVDSEVINVPSIIGFDTYAISLQKTSNSAGKMLTFEKGKGKVCERTFKLN